MREWKEREKDERVKDKNEIPIFLKSDLWHLKTCKKLCNELNKTK